MLSHSFDKVLVEIPHIIFITALEMTFFLLASRAIEKTRHIPFSNAYPHAVYDLIFSPITVIAQYVDLFGQ